VRYFLIDKVTEFVPGKHARGLKAVTLSDQILHDHFPDFPVMPAALIVEAAAQLGGFLLEMSVNRKGERPRRALLAQIQQAKFYETSGPGDVLDVLATIASTLEEAAQVTAEVRVGDKRIARAKLTFIMKDIDSERVHEQRRVLYRLWTRDFKEPLEIL